MLNIGEFARLGQISPRMLRHYDETSLLKPTRVDPHTGYRFCGVAQLRRLHRLLALRDLGFSLEQIRSMLDDDPPVEQLRGMLRLRQAQVEQDVADEQARLRRIEAHLLALEGSTVMSSLDVAIKTTEPIRIAEASATAPGPSGPSRSAGPKSSESPSPGRSLASRSADGAVSPAGNDRHDGPRVDRCPVRVVVREARRAGRCR